MAMPFLNYAESPLNFEKFIKKPKNSNLKSFWVFLLSIFIYISVFYIFNLSLSTLLCTTTFWFVVSNTLILIIATDFGAFSSSKELDFYDELGKNNVRSKVNSAIVPSFDIQYVKIDEKPMLDQHRREEVDEEPLEKIIGVATAEVSDHSENHESLENKAEILITNENEDAEKFKKNTRENEAKKMEAKCVRSNSDRAMLMAAAAGENGEKRALQRTLSERHEEGAPPRIEENEFSRMSDEELNRRVEEFIRRFNRQIRLQAATSRQNLELHRI